jgi:hypothetical protein
MKSVAQAISGQAATASADASQTRRDGASRGPSPLLRAVADQGKIRLGGAWRLPLNRKAG